MNCSDTGCKRRFYGESGKGEGKVPQEELEIVNLEEGGE